MKAAVVPRIGATWEIREVPQPVPSRNQVLIKIRASGICYTDVHMTQGFLSASFPCILGHEPVGEIVELGDGVTSRKVGDRVGVPWVQSTCGRCEWCQRGRPMYCCEQIGTGVNIPGGHAQYMIAYADATQLLPANIEYEQAAPVFCAGYTAYSGLRMADPNVHERVAIVGIGGLGHLAIQYAKVAGFETIAVTHSKDKEELAYKLGADDVVFSGDALRKHKGADVILATGNSYAAITDALKGLRPDGRMVLMGISKEPLTLNGLDLLLKQNRIIGSLKDKREYLYEALDYVASGQVRVMTESYTLENLAEGYERVLRNKTRFRAVLVD